MNITNTHNYDKVSEMANVLARERGYDGLTNIDDPFLREWILEHASMRAGKKVFISFRLLLTTIGIIFLLILLSQVASC